MSQQELERGDQEVMGMVNSHTTPEAAAIAEDIASAARQLRTEGMRSVTPVAPLGEWKTDTDVKAAELRRQAMWTAVQVLSCILVAALFVAALMNPGFVVHLVNLGLLACGIVAAIIIDRRFRRK